MAVTDLLNEELKEANVRLIVQSVFEFVRGDRPTRQQQLQRSKTLGQAKSLLEFYDLVRQAIEDDERVNEIHDRDKVFLTEEDPDMDAKTEAISYSLMSRQPGAFGDGAPGDAKVRNRRPIFREELDDPEHPGYKFAVTGYFYDNVVRFTCWANTNKAANARAEWFENLMEEYMWFFTMQGVDRVFFHHRGADLIENISGNKWYGRPIDFFVRTEKLRVFKEKTIEEIIVNVMTKQE